MVAVGAVLGYFMGQANLRNYLPFLGGSQLQIISALTVLLLLTTHFITIFSVIEAPLQKESSVSNLEQKNL